MRALAVTTVVLLFLSAACTKAERIPNMPVDQDGPVDCTAAQFKAKEQCFDHAHDACASLGCEDEACSIYRGRASKRVLCDRANARYASHLTLCDGYAGWASPEDTVCRDDPAPGQCKAASSFDCLGVCVPAADAGPPAGRLDQ